MNFRIGIIDQDSKIYRINRTAAFPYGTFKGSVRYWFTRKYKISQGKCQLNNLNLIHLINKFKSGN